MADEIDLRVLSPSREVEGGVSFPSLPVSTTIKELRLKIQNAVPSRPAPDRMRLIYRGRVVADDDETLLNVLGPESIMSSRNQSLHLVLKELPNAAPAPSPAPRSSTVPPNPFRSPQDPLPPTSPLQTNPFRTLPQSRPNSQPQLPQPHNHNHVHHNHPQPPGPIPFAIPPPFGLPPHLQQHLAQAAQNAHMQQTQAPAQGQESGTSTPASDTNAQGPPAGLGNPAHPGMPAPMPNTTHTIRQEGVGPNGQRWTVTWNNTNITVPLQPNAQHIVAGPFLPPPMAPPGFQRPAQRTPSPAHVTAHEQTLPGLRAALGSTALDLDSLGALSQPPGGQGSAAGAPTVASLPPRRVEYVRQTAQNLSRSLDNVDSGLALLARDPLMAQNRELVGLQRVAASLRTQINDLVHRIERFANVAGLAPTASASDPSLLNTSAAASAQSIPSQASSEVPTELFIVSSAQGPVGLLFDQRGTYTTTPVAPALAYQTFDQQFSANRRMIATLGQQMAAAPTNPTLQGQGAARTAPQPPQPIIPAQPAADQPAQNQAQDAAGPAPAAPDNDRVGAIAGHLWLLIKLAVFVYFFAGGGGGWYRPVMLGVIAIAVYLGQMGLFEAQLNIVRRHFEALLPLAERVVQPPNQAPANRVHDQTRTGNVSGRNMTPEEAARRLVQQRQDQRFAWIRDSVRATERAFAIFVASLWPGIGERMVHAQEERVRAERAAEEERAREAERRLQEEQGKREEGEEQVVDKQGEAASPSTVEAVTGEGGLSGKGKGRADDAGETAVSTSSSSSSGPSSLS